MFIYLIYLKAYLYITSYSGNKRIKKESKVIETMVMERQLNLFAFKKPLLKQYFQYQHFKVVFLLSRKPIVIFILCIILFMGAEIISSEWCQRDQMDIN